MLCRLMRHLDVSRKIDLNAEIEKHDHDSDFDTHVETGFQLATFQGPLCAEPVEGLAYFVESLEIDRDGIENEIGTFMSQMAWRPY
jgi:ribosome assembly protein 1